MCHQVGGHDVEEDTWRQWEGFPVPDRAGAIKTDRYDGKVELLTTRRQSLSDLADLVQASSTTAEKYRYVLYNRHPVSLDTIYRMNLFYLYVRNSLLNALCNIMQY